MSKKRKLNVQNRTLTSVLSTTLTMVKTTARPLPSLPYWLKPTVVPLAHSTESITRRELVVSPSTPLSAIEYDTPTFSHYTCMETARGADYVKNMES